MSLPPSADGNDAVRQALRRSLETRMAEMPALSYRDRDASATHVLKVTVGELSAGDVYAQGFRPVRVAFEPRDNGLPLSALGRGLPLVDLAASMSTGLDAAFAVIARERAMLVQPDNKVVPLLADPDSQVRDFAIQVLGERKSKVAVAPLCARLATEPEPELVLRAVGALMAIGDPEAAAPLIELARNRPPELVIQIAYALGSLGGSTAEGYLVTLASGHPVDAVRLAAEEALRDLSAKRRAKKPGLTPSQR